VGDTAQALGKIDLETKEAIPVLIQALNDDYEDVRKRAEEAKMTTAE
jgi:HEAT repeat protein